MEERLPADLSKITGGSSKLSNLYAEISSPKVEEYDRFLKNETEGLRYQYLPIIC